ncbi:tandem-95 repeat protein [Marinimicrobium koreense]|nr:tandem-95 repeat protein [Marinimicrobium koreense]
MYASFGEIGISNIQVPSPNNEPTLTSTGDNPTFIEGGSAASLFSGTTISTSDSGQTIQALTFTVSNLSNGSNERINLDGSTIVLTDGASGTTAGNGLSYSVSVIGGTATVSLTGGSLSEAAAQTLVDNISYQNSSNTPDTTNRVVTLTSLQDSGGTANGGDDTVSLAVDSTVTMVETNDEPTLTATGSNPTFTEGGSAAGLFSGTSVSTIEAGQTLGALTLTVTNVNDGTDEVLYADGTAIALTDGTSGTTATNSLSYSVSVAGTTATVSLSGGTLSSAATQTLVNGLSYQNNSNTPDTSNRVVTITSLQDDGGTANGGDDTASLAVASTVTLNGVNDEPMLTATGSNPVFTEGGAAASLFSGASIGTVESGQTVNGLTFTVSNVTNGSNERINLDGSTIVLTDGTSGTTASNGLSYSVSVVGGTATVSLTGGALSEAAAQTLIDNISYQNNSNSPDTSDRVVTLTSLQDSGGTANGGDDTVSLAETSTVTVVGTNDEPTLTATGSNPTFTEGGAAAGLFSGASVSTVEFGQALEGLTFTVTNVNNGSDEVVNVDGTAIALTNGTSGTTATNSLSYSVSVSGTTATVSLSGGTLSSAATQTLVDSLSYQNNSNTPDTSNRVVTITSLQDNGGTGNGGSDTALLAVASTVTVSEVNDEPTLTATATDPNFSEGGSAVGLYSGASVSTIESGQTVSSFTLTVSNLSNGVSETLNADGSSIALTHGTSGSTSNNGLSYSVAVVGSTATVSFTGGSLSGAQAQSLIDNLSYLNTSVEVSTSSRVVTLTSVTDSGGTANGGDDTAALSIASSVSLADDVSPLVSDANISLSGSSGNGGAYVLGDTVTATWDNTAGGDNNSDIISSVAIDFSAFGGGASVPATNSSGTWSASYTIDGSSTSGSNLNVSVSATDNAGNTTTVADSSNAEVDNAAPTGHSVSFDDANVDASEASSIGFTFSGAEVGTSYSYSISSSGGGSNLTNTGTITSPGEQVTGIDASGLGNGTLTLAVTLTDSAGNAATAVTDTASLDTTVPTTSLSTAASDPTNGAFDITVTFGETVSGFDVSDITATNASLSSFSGSGASYTATVTPTTDGSVNVDVAADVAQDSVGNGNTAATTLSLTYDGTAPAPAITSAETSPSNSASFTATIDFGETVIGFAVGDISAGNASLSGFTDNGDGSFDVTVAPSSEGTVTLDVGASAAQDTAGNNSEAASQFSLEHDDSAPSLTGSSPVDGATGVWFNTDIDLTFSEAVTGQSGGVIEVFEADGTPVSSVSATSSDVSISGSTATIDIPDLEPTVSYYVQVSSGAFADSAGNIYGGIADPSELNFTVTNLAPSAGGDAAQIVEDQSADLGILNNDSDPEGDLNPASVQIVTPPAHGSTSIDTGSGAVTYTPDANFAGQDSFTYTVEDALGAVSNEATMTIGIININDAPVAGDDTANTPEDNPISIDVAADDTDIDDGDSVDPSTIVITAAPANGSAELVNGEVLYTPNTDFNGTDQFSYTIEDQNGGVSNAATVIVNVNGVNDTPTAADDSASVDEDNPVDVDVTANDSDIDGSVDATTVQVLDDVTNGTLSVDGTTGVVTYTPDENFNGTDTFTYVVQDDANGTSNEATVTLTVNPVNDAPVAEDNAATLQEETPHEVNVLGNDSDVDGSLDTASVEVVSAPSDGSTAIDTATGAITYTPDENFDGNDSFTYRVTDNEGAWSNVATVSMTVQGVNDAPLANDDDATTEEDTPATIDLLTNDNDVDGTLDVASIALTSPTHGSVSLNGDGTATYTPDEHFNGADSFTYTVNDDVGEPSNSATVSVTVTPVNDAPTLRGTPAASVNEGEAYSFTPTADDVDANETLTFSVTGQPAWAEFDNTTGALTGTPGIAASGRYPGIVISVSDGDATTDLAAFSIEVIDVNNVPTIGGMAPTTATVGQAYTFTATAEDSDESDTLTFSAAGLPGWLTLDSSTGELTGTPADDDVGSYTGLQVSVSDGAESASLAAFDLTVEPGADSDGDSFSDYQENLDGTDPNDPASYLDLMPPQLVAPEERVLDSEALFTQITLRDLLGLDEEASEAELQDALDQLASDDIDGDACCYPRVEGMEGNQLRLAPGRHEITWLAEDFQSNSAEATQVVNIRPMVSLSKDQVAVAGSTAVFSVILNGESPFYPLVIPYRVSDASTANDEDHDLTDGTVVLEAGEQRKTVEVTLAPNDGESRETLIIELDDRTGNDDDLADGYDKDNPNIYDINSGAKRQHRIAIVDGNVAPRVQLQLVQGEENRRLIPIEGGTATVTALVTDPNVGDSHQYDWSASDSALVDTDGDTGNNTLVFEPQALNPGRYRVATTVTDSAGEATSVSRHFLVVPVPPTLSPDEDSDGDGVDDDAEGFADDNGNGIPNYQDSLISSNVLLESAERQDAFLMECDPGLSCGLGAFALPTDNGGAQVGEETVGPTGAIPEDASFEPVGGIFDFELGDLPEPGQSARIVIPQTSPIPAQATYRKFQDGAWVTFVEDANNALHSAAGNPGYCPPPGDDDWENGLIEGYHCVQLTIEDGGPNDADGETNGNVADPGAVSRQRGDSQPEEPNPENPDQGASGYDGEVTTRSSGGGATGTWLLISLLGLGLLRSRPVSRRLGALIGAPLLGLTLMGASLDSVAQAVDPINDMRFELGLYSAKSSVSAGDFAQRMASHSDPISLSQYDVSRRSISLGIELPLAREFSLTLGYLNLGETQARFQTQVDNSQRLQQALEQHYPYSAKGWTLGQRLRLPLHERVSLLAEVGLYRWRSEVSAIGPQITPESTEGTDPLLGLGLEMPLNERVSAGLKIQRVFFGNQQVDLTGATINWRF